MKPDKVLSILGIAAKAGYIASGEFQTERAIKTSMAHLVIVAEDASENTKKMFRNMCEFYEVPQIIYGTKDQIGHAVGKEYRSSLAVTDHGLAKSVFEKYEMLNNLNHGGE